jgi:hypothetical protein
MKAPTKSMKTMKTQKKTVGVKKLTDKAVKTKKEQSSSAALTKKEIWAKKREQWKVEEKESEEREKTDAKLKEDAKKKDAEKTASTLQKVTLKKITRKKVNLKKVVLKTNVAKQLGTETRDIPTNYVNVPAFFPKHAEYRLSDIVSTTKWREDNMTEHEYEFVVCEVYDQNGNFVGLEEEGYKKPEKESLETYLNRLFPDSIAVQYLKRTKKVNDIKVLSKIVDEYVTSRKTPTPDKNTMVLHLRVGDVIDGTDVPLDDFFNRRVNSFYALFGEQPDGWSPVYVRCLASFDRALKKTKELGFHKISLVYGFHI